MALAAPAPDELAADLRRIQNDLFHLGADLCVTEEQKSKRPLPRIEGRHVLCLEELIDRWNERLEPLANFVLPGGSPAAAPAPRRAHRLPARRASRWWRSRARSRSAIRPLPYLNRLSDALFVLARAANRLAGIAEPLWDSRK